MREEGVFKLAEQRLQQNRLSASTRAGKVDNFSSLGFDTLQDDSTSITNRSSIFAKASVRIADRRRSQEADELQAWMLEQRQNPVVEEYFAAYCNKNVMEARLAELTQLKQPAIEDVQSITELRHKVAVMTKRTISELRSI